MHKILSLMMAVILAAVGCAGPGKPAQASTVQASQALSEPVYPQFPTYPELPVMGNGDAEAYYDALNSYHDALQAIRGPGITEEIQENLNRFAAKSTPLVLAGREGENTIYSPLSLWSALAMLAQCAEGNSRQQVLDAIDAANASQLQEDVSRIWRALYTDDGSSSLLLANSIWLNSGMQGAYVQNTLDILAQKHFAGVYSIPMGTSQADQAVTDWVKKQTNGLIGGDTPVVQTDPETLALLASSLYYRAGWMDEFSPELTEEDIFTDASGQDSRTDFMHMTQDGSFLRQEGWQAAQLRTRLGEMIFVLPDQGITPDSLLQNPDFLPGLSIHGHGDQSIWGEIRWSVPKFDVNSDLNLLSSLSALGITDLLNPDKADLSALTDLDTVLSDAKQLARVKVDEEGVEGAAVTILMMNTTSAMPDPDPEICVMDLDRPFLFVIRTEGVPLFIGVVNQM